MSSFYYDRPSKVPLPGILGAIQNQRRTSLASGSAPPQTGFDCFFDYVDENITNTSSYNSGYKSNPISRQSSTTVSHSARSSARSSDVSNTSAYTRAQEARYDRHRRLWDRYELHGYHEDGIGPRLVTTKTNKVEVSR